MRRRGTGNDGAAVEVSLEVVCKLGGGGVAIGRITLKRLEDDVVEIAPDAAPQLVHGLWSALDILANVGAGRSEVVRTGQFASEQHVENHTERIDVRGARAGFAGVLFRAGVVGRQKPHLRRGDVGLHGPGHLGDAEIEEFGGGSGRHHDVAGLQVAVDDEVLMEIMDGGADLHEQLDAFADVEPVVVAVAVQRGAFNELHDVIGRTVGGVAAVEDAGDVGVFEAGEDLAFLAEAVGKKRGVLIGDEKLQCDILAECAIVADRQKDDAHAAAAEFADDAVGAKPHGGPLGGSGGRDWRALLGGRIEK